MFLVIGVLAALLEARRHGRGQVVDAAMVDGTALLDRDDLRVRSPAGIWRDERAANLLDGGAPFYDIYETADGRHVAVGALEPQFYAALVEAARASPARSGPQYDVASWPSTARLFAEPFAARTRAEWTAVFDGTDACVAPVLTLSEAPAHAHLAARGTFVEQDGRVRRSRRRASRARRPPGTAARAGPAPTPARRWRPGGSTLRRCSPPARRSRREPDSMPVVKPFLFLGTRAEDDVADGEYEAVLRFAGLDRARRCAGSGSSGGRSARSTSTTGRASSSAAARSTPATAGAEVGDAAAASRPTCASSPTRVVDGDFPFLGACYGIGILGHASRRRRRPDLRRADRPGAVRLTDEGRRATRSSATLPDAVRRVPRPQGGRPRLPEGAVLLASSPRPARCRRSGSARTSTPPSSTRSSTFPGCCTRIEVYRHHGYFRPRDVEVVLARASTGVVTEPPRLLAAFAERLRTLSGSLTA